MYFYCRVVNSIDTFILSDILKSMEIISFLEEYGFTQKEAGVYVAILQLGHASVGDVAKIAKIKRPTTYIILDELMRKGLVDLLPKENKTYYIAKSPEIILKMLSRKEKLAQSFIPQLMALFNETKEKPKVQYFEGEDAAKKAYDDSIKEGKKVFAFFGAEDIPGIWENQYANEYMTNRIKNEIQARVIVSSGAKALEYKRRGKLSMRETKIVDAKKFPLKVEVLIYGNKIAIISFDKSYGFSLIIQNDQFATTMKSVFNFMWENIK